MYLHNISHWQLARGARVPLLALLVAVSAEQAALAPILGRHGVVVDVEVGGEAELGVDLALGG